ncbi:MAG: hypothetical protein KGY76_05575 [Candidatus Thermoplasmatota archaeon]|nr:hypothetical protein [Candidatus Thermoplasmatota archaeon]
MNEKNSGNEEEDEKSDGGKNVCPSCGEPVNAEDIECKNCGETLLGDEPIMADEDEDISTTDLNLKEQIESESKKQAQRSDSGDIPSGLSSLGEMIEEKVMTSVKKREERIRDSMKKTVRERERKIREKMQDRIDELREKYEEEKSDLMDQLDKERDEKEKVRREFEEKIEGLREKIDEKTKELDELKEKHVQEKDDLRKEHEQEINELEAKIADLKEEHTEEKEELKDELRDEKEELREKYEEEKKELRQEYEKEKKELQEKIEELRDQVEERKKEAEEKRDELREKYEEEKKDLRKRLEEEKEELEEKLREEKKELRYNLEKEKADMKNRLEKEIEDLQDRLDEEKKGGDAGMGLAAMMGGSGPEQLSGGFAMGDGLSDQLDTKLKEPVFPFPAIVGQERMKRALLLNSINPKIRGVLIWGEKGCGKRTAMVALAELLSEIEDVDKGEEEEVKVWNDPERYMTGTIHSNKTDTSLMVDKVLKNGAMNIKKLENCEKTGTPMIKVDNLSYIDKYMLSHLESFNIQVKVEMIEDVDKRREIIRRNKEYEEDPKAFYEDYEDQCHDLRDRIVKTRQTLPAVTIGPRQRNTISDISAHASLPAGSDIILEEVARTVTAYDGREEVVDDDIKEGVDIIFVSQVKDYLLEEI